MEQCKEGNMCVAHGENFKYFIPVPEQLTQKILRDSLSGIGITLQNIEKIVIPRNVSEIEAGCFMHCFQLVVIKFQEDSQLRIIKAGAFCDTGLTQISLPDSVEEIGDGCFAMSRNLRRVSFGRRIKHIGNGCFRRCVMLNVIDFGDGVCITKQDINSLVNGNKRIEVIENLHHDYEVSKLFNRHSEDTHYVLRNSHLILETEKDIIESDIFYGSQFVKTVTFGPVMWLRTINHDSFGNSTLEYITIPRSVEALCVRCFCGAKNLVRVTFEAGSCLKRIEEYAFYESGLQTIEIPVSLELICDHAFSECASLQYFSFAEGSNLRRIGNSVLSRCLKLREFVIPASVELIGKSCFADSSISRVVFERGIKVKHFSSLMFSGCRNLTEIEIPASVETIDYECLLNCCSLRRVVFPPESCLTRIGVRTFCGCRSLLSIDIPGKVLEISEGCFAGSYVSRVTFSNNSEIKRLGNLVFSGCDTLTDIEIPASVEEIGDGCLRNCSSLSIVLFAKGSRLKKIGNFAFYNCTNIEEIEIPDTVEEIGYGCFAGCDIWYFSFSGHTNKFIVRDGLIVEQDTNTLVATFRNVEEFVVPSDIHHIGKGCFAGSSIVRIVFTPESKLVSIGDGAFSLCDNLQEIVIPLNVSTIGDYCFACSLLNTFTGTGLKCIGRNTFFACRNLKGITIPTSVETIGATCFRGCSSLDSVVFKYDTASLLKYTDYSAYYNSHDFEIKIPHRLLDLSSGVFSNCVLSDSGSFGVVDKLILRKDRMCVIGLIQNVEHIVMPPLIEEISDMCFSSSCLVGVRFDHGSCLKRLGAGAFRDCKRLKNIDIPDSVNYIGDECFKGCSAVEITFPRDGALKYIGKKAFYGCGLTFMKVPASVEEIGDGCFENCSRLNSVGFHKWSRIKRIGSHALRNCRALEKLVIPDTVEDIGDGVISGCDNVTVSWEKYGSHEFPRSILILAMDSMYSTGKFSRESSLVVECESKEIEIPASIETLGNECFSVLPHVTFANGKTSADSEYWIHVLDLIQEYLEQFIKGCKLSKSYYVENIRELIIPRCAVRIEEGCCYGLRNLKRVEYEEGSQLKIIGNRAFSECQNLNIVVLPKSVEEIGDECCKGCNKLEYIAFGDELWSNGVDSVIVGDDCACTQELVLANDPEDTEGPGDPKWPCGTIFDGDLARNEASSNVTYVSNSELKRIGNEAFSGCPLNEVGIPASVQEIGEKAFRDCSSLYRVVFEKNSSLEILGESAFDSCRNLREIEIPANISKIPCQCFYNCGLSNVTFAHGRKLTYIEEKAFCHNSCMTEITIPSSVRKIGEGCFAGCSSLARVTFVDSGLFKSKDLEIGKCALSGTKVELITVTNGTAVQFQDSLDNIPVMVS